MRLTFGAPELRVTPGEAARIGVAGGLSIEMTVSSLIKLCEDAGPDVMELFFGKGWKTADRTCREGFHRRQALYQADRTPMALCQGDVDVMRRALGDLAGDPGDGAGASPSLIFALDIGDAMTKSLRAHEKAIMIVE